MAGLGVLLETKESGFPRYSHVLSKTSLLKNASSASAGGGSFLEHCYLCRRKLLQGKDIYMYRGDRAFCSEECRCRQIFTDEESGMRDHCSLAAAAAAAAASATSAGRRPARGWALAGGFAC